MSLKDISWKLQNILLPAIVPKTALDKSLLDTDSKLPITKPGGVPRLS